MVTPHFRLEPELQVLRIIGKGGSGQVLVDLQDFKS